MLRLYRKSLASACTFQLRSIHIEQGEWNVWLTKHRLSLNDAMHDVMEAMAQKAESLHIDQGNWKAYVNKFRRDLINDPNSLIKTAEDFQVIRSIAERFSGASPEELRKGLSKSDRKSLYNIIAAECVVALKDVILVNKTLVSATDMSVPHAWYPVTRIMKRKIIYHGGPTNSGKVSSPSIL